LMHLKPAEGKSRNVGHAIIEHMFPPAHYKTFPLIGVTGSTGTTLITRLMFHFLKLNGLCTGLANVDGVQVDDRKLNASVSSSWSDTQRLLLHCQLEAAVVENDGMQILTQGLDYSKCLIGIVTDLHFSDVFKGPSVAYHNFETAEDLIKVYRTQIDVVCPTGTGVLNADDPNVAAIAEYCRGALTFFSQNPQAEIIQTHLAKGLRAVLLDLDQIILVEGSTRTTLCALSAIPVFNTNELSRQANMAPLLASVAAAWALNLPLEVIRSGLQTY